MKKIPTTPEQTLSDKATPPKKLQLNHWLLNHIKPTHVGLTAISATLFVGLVGVSVAYVQNKKENTQLRQQVKNINKYSTTEAALKIKELKKTEQSVNDIEAYLQERGASNPPPKAKDGLTVAPQSSYGHAQRTSSKNVYSSEYSIKVQRVLEAARSVPLGVPHNGQINSRFGGRSNPFGGHSQENHKGLDFKGTTGDPVHATADGVVVQAGNVGGYGKAIKIKHGFTYETLYGHLSSIDVKVGQKIRAGDSIGKLGSTGRSTGPHLHYEVRLDGTQLDPERFLRL